MQRRDMILFVIVVLLAGISVWFYYSDTAPEKLISGLRGGAGEDLQVFPYDTEHSLTLRKIKERKSKFYEYSTEWQPEPWGAKSTSGKHLVKMYPFPLVEGLDRDFTLKSRIDINKLPPVKKWERFGIQGVGVVTSLAIDAKDMKHLLLGTEYAGLYESITFGNKWQRLKFNRNDIKKALIDPDNPKHYIVATGAYHFADMPQQIFHSQDAGKTWDKGETPFIQLNQFAQKEEIIPNDIYFNSGTVMISGHIKGNTKKKVIATKNEGSAADKPYTNLFQVVRDELLRLKMKKTGKGLVNYFNRVPAGPGKETIDDELYLTTDGWKTAKIIFDPETQGYPLYDVTAYDITPDGQRMAVYLRAPQTLDSVIAKSKDGGQTWQFMAIETLDFVYFDEGWELNKDTKVLDQTAQDIVLLADDEDYIGLFLYMHGLFESFDGGQTFSKVIDGYQNVRFLTNADGETQAIEPVDLRVDTLKPLPSKDGVNYFIPTDQGLFLYQATTARLINVTKDLYLGDSAQVAVTSCPRVYAGLWHVGSYWINEDNSIEGFNGGENNGYGAGPDDGCATPVFSPVHGYLSDGKNIDEKKTEWFDTFVDLGWPVSETFQYHDGWWYEFRWWWSDQVILRINDAFDKFEEIYANDDKNIKVLAYGMDLWKAGSPVWVLGTDKILRTMASNGTWAIVKDLNGATPPFHEIMNKAKGIKVWDKRVVIWGTAGLLVSLDAGNAWEIGLKGRKVWAVEQDKCGGIYAAVQPMPDSGYGGVFYSPSDGKSFSKLGQGDNRSYISGLAIDHIDDILYAGTKGESLLRMGLDACAVD